MKLIDNAEAIHPEFDALLRARFDDPATVAVYADWLEEREDPRGALMRMASRSTEAGVKDGFIHRHWARWFGDALPRDPGGMTWESVVSGW